MIHNNILTLIGNTPMVRINKLTGENDATILAKLEEYNIGGSAKDRTALYMIEDAEKSGTLTKDKILLEASSGNTGIAMAMIAGVKGYNIEIVIPASVSVERRKLIKAYGAKLILSPGAKGTGGAVELKNKLLAEKPDRYVNLDQFKNPATIAAHYETTAREILEQTKGKIDMVVVGLGTAGTGIGISKRLKEHNLKMNPSPPPASLSRRRGEQAAGYPAPAGQVLFAASSPRQATGYSHAKIKIVGVLPELGSAIQGLRHPKEPNPTQLFNEKYFDEIIEIKKELIPETIIVARNLAKREGILTGMSSGAAMYVALKKAKILGKGKVIVAILPDTGERYLSTNLFE